MKRNKKRAEVEENKRRKRGGRKLEWNEKGKFVREEAKKNKGEKRWKVLESRRKRDKEEKAGMKDN